MIPPSRTWSTGRNINDGWPDHTNDSENKDWSVGHASAATAYTDLVQEFEPGKPWKVNILQQNQEMELKINQTRTTETKTKTKTETIKTTFTLQTAKTAYRYNFLLMILYIHAYYYYYQYLLQQQQVQMLLRLVFKIKLITSIAYNNQANQNAIEHLCFNPPCRGIQNKTPRENPSTLLCLFFDNNNQKKRICTFPYLFSTFFLSFSLTKTRN